VAVTLAAFCISIILFSVLYMMYSRVNVARDNDLDGAQSADATVDLIDAFSDLTDKENKKTRYKL
jgi:ACS family allantoate permease-like MFS transporter